MRESSSRVAAPAAEDAAGDSFHDHPVVHAVSIGFAFAFSWLVVKFTNESMMRYDHYGFISGPALFRVLAVAFDLYVAGSLVNSFLDKLRRPLAEAHHRIAFIAGCLALAFALHYTGTIGKAYRALGLAPPGPAALIGMLESVRPWQGMPETPLEAFAGEWRGIGLGRRVNSPALGWVSRVQIAVANGEARIRLWRWCGTGECDGGTYPALIDSPHRGSVAALHATGNMDGTDWLVTLYWRQQKGDMELVERQLRGNNLQNSQGNGDVLRRVKL